MAKYLSKIYLVNWYLFGEKLISIDGHTALLGANGAGKSSLIDAVQTVLLGGDKRYIRYNPGVDERSRRNLMSYALGVWKEIDGGGELKERTSSNSYIALEFKSDGTGSAVTVGVGIEAQWPSKGEIETHFILREEGIKREFFISGDSAPFSSTEFVRQMKERFGQAFTNYETHESFLKALMNSLSSDAVRLHPEKFRKNFRNALIFKKIDSVEQFVKEYVLEERPVDTRRLKRSLDVFREIKEKADRTEGQLSHLRKIGDILADIERHERSAVLNRYVALSSALEKYRNEMTFLTGFMNQLNEKWTATLQEKEDIGKERELLNGRVTQLTINLHKDSRYVRLTELRGKMESGTERLEELKNRIFGRMASVRSASSVPETVLSAIKDEEIPSLLEQLKAALEVEDHSLISKIADRIREFADSERVRADERIAEAGLKITALKESLERTEKDILELEGGKAPLPAHYLRLRDILKNALKNAGYEDYVAPACDLLDIKDKDWQKAVEAFLGDNRFSLLVHPEMVSFCLRVYRSFKESEGIYDVKLVDTERCLKESRPALKGSVAEEIMVDKSVEADALVKKAAAAYMETILGSVMKAETNDELRSHRRAITKDCVLFANFSIQRLRPERQPVFGRTGREAYLKTLRTEKDRILQEIESLNMALVDEKNTRHFLKNMSDGLGCAASLVEDSGAMKKITEEIGSFEKEIAGLQSGSISEMEDEIKRIKDSIGEMETRLRRLEADAMGNRDQYSQAEQNYTEARIYAGQKEGEAAALNPDEDIKVKASELMEKEAARGLGLKELEENYQKKAEASQKKRMDAEKTASNELIIYASKYEHQINEEMRLAPQTAKTWMESETKRLEDTELARYKNEANKAMEDAHRVFQEEFIHKLKDNILSSEDQRMELNSVLKSHTFHGERYFFEKQPNPKYSPFLDMVMDSENTRMDSPLFGENSDFRQRHRKALDDLERLFRMNSDMNAERELEDISDYRNYYRYEIVSTDGEGNRTTLTHRLKTGSGGEIQTPFYVAIASALANTYRMTEAIDGIRLAVFDEAFSKMDQGNVENALNFMKEMGLQVILAAPDDKANIFLPHINTVLLIYRRGNRVRLDRYEVKDGISGLYEQPKAKA